MSAAHALSWLVQVTVVPKRKVLEQRAYLLFYTHRGKLPPPPRLDEPLPEAPATPTVATPTPTASGDAATDAAPGADAGGSGGGSGDADAADTATGIPAPSGESVPCATGCGFYGTAATENMCTHCFAKAKGLDIPGSSSSSASSGAVAASSAPSPAMMQGGGDGGPG